MLYMLIGFGVMVSGWKQALDAGLISERFTEHDLRSKVASDTDLEHARALLVSPQETLVSWRMLMLYMWGCLSIAEPSKTVFLFSLGGG